MTAPLPDLPDAVRSQWPYRPNFARVNGWRMHYVDEGAGDPVVLLHGNPTWGFLYRDFVKPLTDAGHRVIIPDMIGFGLSEKPTREDAHSLDGHIANLTALLGHLDLESRHGLLDPGAHVAHDFVDAALTRVLQANEEVALVGLRHTAAELQAGAPRITFDLRRLHQFLFHVVQHSISFFERGSGRRPVIEDESALVELRQKF